VSQCPKETKEVIFEQMKAVARAIVQTFGPGCEVLLHDLENLEQSIIWIEGNVTDRKIGGSMTDLGLAKIRAGDLEDLYCYSTHSEDGKTLKSSSVFLRDKEGKAFGALCINLDLTPFLAFGRTLRAISQSHDAEGHDAQGFDAQGIVETFSDDIHEIIETMIAESAYELGKTIPSMTKDDRVALIGMLESKGAFQVKKAVPIIAMHLGVSRYTIYNYLNEARAA